MSLLIQEMPDTKESLVSPLYGDKTVIYCRTANGGNEAIERQTELLMRYSLEQGYQVAAVYSDCNESGGALSRPSMQMLLNDVRSGQVSRVIATDLARLCRNLLHFSELVHLFEDYGVELIAVKDGGAVNMFMTIMYADAFMKFIKQNPNGMGRRKRA
ncbi:MAG: recombinase family protein [Clostridiales bacterium]|jgi:DNA invertase Pin-like site-specific DNA recombinase|nr:recombinase family protein [Clostridiales bacterium]